MNMTTARPGALSRRGPQPTFRPPAQTPAKPGTRLLTNRIWRALQPRRGHLAHESRARRELLPLGRAADGALAEHIAARAPIHEALALSTPERTDVYGIAASPEHGEPARRDPPQQLAGPLDPGQAHPSQGLSDDAKRPAIAYWADTGADPWAGVAEGLKRVAVLSSRRRRQT